uniref:Uncharacterized protein n=1 Tax=Anguilla anguilla TaxID=7936 RepID=A0A0E9V823_ANGAN
MSGNSPHQPPMCSIHQGDAWQSFLPEYSPHVS